MAYSVLVGNIGTVRDRLSEEAEGFKTEWPEFFEEVEA
jgi:hypothetical protein